MTVFRNLERAYITSQTATHTLKRVYLLKVGAWCLSSSFRLSHGSLITNTKLMLQVQVATKLGHAWCLSSSFWLSHNYLSTNTTLMLQVGILMQSTVSRKKPDVGPKHLNQKNTCLTTARPTQSKTPVCQFQNVFRACISSTYFWKFAPLVLTARRNALLWGHFPWVDMPLIQNPKSAQENDRLFQNLCRKIIFEIQPAEKKSQLVWKKHDAYHTHITLKPRIFWLWLGEAQDWHVTPALDDLASSTGMSVMFADRNFGTLRCTDALQNQTQIELKWQNISESEVMLQRVFLAKQHDQPKQGP